MRNTKGFTLIELLAVIVILAIIALIATPMILGVIDSAKKGAAESSAYGYLDAVEKSSLQNILNSAGNNEIPLKDGLYTIGTGGTKIVHSDNSEIPVSFKGQNPAASEGGKPSIKVKNGIITEANLKINGYNVVYKANKAQVTTDDFTDLVAE